MPTIQTRLSTSSPSSSSPKHSSPTSTSPSTMSSTSIAKAPPPYMVALSGWPEPVYISNNNVNRSRPTTPRPVFPGEVSDGIAMPPPPLPSSFTHPNLFPYASSSSRGGKPDVRPGKKDDHRPIGSIKKEGEGAPLQSIFSKECVYEDRPGSGCTVPNHPNHMSRFPPTGYGGSSSGINNNRANDKSSSFPTSSTRTPTHSPPPPSSSGAFPSLQQYSSNTSRHATFHDPRFAPHVAVLSNRPALPVAPNWTTSHTSVTSLPPIIPLPNVGVKVPAGERGTGILVLRAVPDVYPPPMAPSGMAGMASGMTRNKMSTPAVGGHLGVATEVYPRDPDSAFLWGSAASPQVGSQLEEDIDMDQNRDGW